MITSQRARTIGGGLPIGAGDARYLRLDGGNSPIADIDWGGQDLTGLGDVFPDADGTRNLGGPDLAFLTGWIRTVRADVGQNVRVLLSGGSGMQIFNGGGGNLNLGSGTFVFNEGGVDVDWRFEGDADPNLVFVEAGTDRVGIGTDSPAGKLDVDQSSLTGSVPVLHLDQADVSEEFIEFVSTIGIGDPIEAVGAKTLTVTHFARMSVIGVGAATYLALGTIA